jgi:hypothetical protein
MTKTEASNITAEARLRSVDTKLSGMQQNDGSHYREEMSDG